MFDDPKKSLRRLEEELWDAEYGSEEEAEEELEPEWPEDIFGCGEDAEQIQDAWALLEEDEEDEEEDETPSPRKRRRGLRNDAVDFHRTVYADEEMDENSAVFVEKKKKKKAGCGCLPVILLLELAGIAGIIWWWIRWLR